VGWPAGYVVLSLSLSLPLGWLGSGTSLRIPVSPVYGSTLGVLLSAGADESGACFIVPYCPGWLV
jgi:hypothetical protein